MVKILVHIFCCLCGYFCRINTSGFFGSENVHIQHFKRCHPKDYQFTAVYNSSMIRVPVGTHTNLIGKMYFLPLIINEEHFFLCLLAICISCYELCLPMFLFFFKLWKYKWLLAQCIKHKWYRYKSKDFLQHFNHIPLPRV